MPGSFAKLPGSFASCLATFASCLAICKMPGNFSGAFSEWLENDLETFIFIVLPAASRLPGNSQIAWQLCQLPGNLPKLPGKMPGKMPGNLPNCLAFSESCQATLPSCQATHKVARQIAKCLAISMKCLAFLQVAWQKCLLKVARQ